MNLSTTFLMLRSKTNVSDSFKDTIMSQKQCEDYINACRMENLEAAVDKISNLMLEPTILY